VKKGLFELNKNSRKYFISFHVFCSILGLSIFVSQTLGESLKSTSSSLGSIQNAPFMETGDVLMDKNGRGRENFTELRDSEPQRKYGRPPECHDGCVAVRHSVASHGAKHSTNLRIVRVHLHDRIPGRCSDAKGGQYLRLLPTVQNRMAAPAS
jgi:hypothetical protein